MAYRTNDHDTAAQHALYSLAVQHPSVLSVMRTASYAEPGAEFGSDDPPQTPRRFARLLRLFPLLAFMGLGARKG